MTKTIKTCLTESLALKAAREKAIELLDSDHFVNLEKNTVYYWHAYDERQCDEHVIFYEYPNYFMGKKCTKCHKHIYDTRENDGVPFCNSCWNNIKEISNKTNED